MKALSGFYCLIFFFGIWLGTVWGFDNPLVVILILPGVLFILGGLLVATFGPRRRY